MKCFRNWVLALTLILGIAAAFSSCTAKKADLIIKNAKIFSSDQNNPQATALVVKDGRFVYVGDESGLSKYKGEITDLGGKFRSEEHTSELQSR